jgi:hypothetical protein
MASPLVAAALAITPHLPPVETVGTVLFFPRPLLEVVGVVLAKIPTAVKMVALAAAAAALIITEALLPELELLVKGPAAAPAVKAKIKGVMAAAGVVHLRRAGTLLPTTPIPVGAGTAPHPALAAHLLPTPEVGAVEMR